MSGLKVSPNDPGQPRPAGSTGKRKTRSYMLGVDDAHDWEAAFSAFMAGCSDDDVEPFMTGVTARSGLEPSRTMARPLRRRRRVSPSHPYRGIWQRAWGRWSAEIRDPIKGIRRWIGTFDTATDAARAFDAEARRIHGSKARTNFPTELATPDSCRCSLVCTTPEGNTTSSEVYSSETSDTRILLECCSDDVMDSLLAASMPPAARRPGASESPQLTTYVHDERMYTYG
ncbi:unnamed protein product [Alopecurus aequalis]